MSQTILHKLSIYKGGLFTLSRVDLLTEQGVRTQRDVIDHPGAVAIVAIDAEQRILMVRQFRTAAQRTLLEIPAGTLEAGEDPRVCAERELQEEVGYRPGTLESLGGIYLAPSYDSEYIHLFLATDLVESRLEGDADEHIVVERWTLSDLLTAIDSGAIEDGKTICALSKAARRIGM